MTLRWYQQEAINSIFQYFQNHKGNPIVCLPTGTGKSHVIGGFIKSVFGMWPNQRMIMATHVKDLIEQNAEKLLHMWPTAPLGINSDGLKQRDTVAPIIYGGIGSMLGMVDQLGHRDLLLVDEGHLISPDEKTMYRRFINLLKKTNPHLKVVGFTATKFRMKQGLLIEGDSIFTDICYDMTTMDGFNRLLNEGFLTPLIPRPTATKIDISNVGIQAGEYNQKQLKKAVDKQEITYAAVQEAVQYGHDRNCWLVFSDGIEHAEHISDMMTSFGVDSSVVHSKLAKPINEARIKAWKRGEIKCLVNKDMLTTGIDNPMIDLIVMIRHTISAGLWVQMLGRGTRTVYAPGYDLGSIAGRLAAIAAGPKHDCLVLDFAANSERLGPINDPIIPSGKKKGQAGDAPIKICEKMKLVSKREGCGVYNHPTARNCVSCGEEFSFEVKLNSYSANHELITTGQPQVEKFPVDSVTYKRVQFGEKLPMMKVSYFTGLRKFDEFVCLEHPHPASKYARDWWRERHNTQPPLTITEALKFQAELRVPRQMRVWINNPKYPNKIMGFEY